MGTMITMINDMRKVLIFLTFSALVFTSAAAQGGREAAEQESPASAFINRLETEGKLPQDPAWVKQLKENLENRMGRGNIHPSALTIVAEIFPARTADSEPALTGELAAGLLEGADESLRRGTGPARVRSELRQRLERLGQPGANEGAAVRTEQREKKKRIGDKIANRGRSGSSAPAPPGIEDKTDGPSEVPPEIPGDSRDEEDRRQGPEQPGR